MLYVVMSAGLVSATKSPVQEWKDLFSNVHSLDELKRVESSALRSVRWKAFLLYRSADPSSWVHSTKRDRQAYDALKTKYISDRKNHVDGVDVNVVNPLSLDEDNPWKEYYKDEELRKQIMQDIERTFPDNDFFRKKEVQSMLLDLLFVYCKMNEDVSYRQGMHEILAPILLVVQNDSMMSPTVEQQTVDQFYVEHDTFSLFQALMRHAKAWYELGDEDARHSQITSPIVEKSRRLQEEFLAKVDPELERYLTYLDIEPQIWGIKWIRLLFGREFAFEEVLRIWDLLFAEDPTLQLVDFICVAMLIRVRSQLLDADASTALTILLRYPCPQVEGIGVGLVRDAVYLRDHFSLAGGQHIINKHTQSTAPSSPTRRERSPNRHSANIEAIVSDVARNMLDRGEKWGVNKYVREAVAVLQASPSMSEKEDKDTPDRNHQMAQLLAVSINTLETRIRVEDDESNKAIATLRHIRECLCDGLREVDGDVMQKSVRARPPKSPFATTPKSSRLSGNWSPAGFARMASAEEITPPRRGAGKNSQNLRDISLGSM